MTESSSVGVPLAKRPVWRRTWTWVIVVIAAFGLWLAVSLAFTALHAKRANSALQAMSAQIGAGQTQEASASADIARENTQAARSDIDSLPISALRVIPYFNTNLEGASDFLAAALNVLDAAETTNQMYARLTGADGTQEAAFDAGRINAAALQDVQPQIDQVSVDLAKANVALHQIPPDISPLLREYVDEAQARIDGIQRGLRVYSMIEPALPELLGETKPATYLVVFHNPGELYPGGGAALSAAVVEFNNGKMDVVDKGAVSSHFFPGNPEVPWDPAAGGPYYATDGATDGFAWSNLHQDYRITGENLLRSWEANGGQPVDGVISLDPIALQAAVGTTGPIQSPLYGEINADNLVQKLLYEGYNEDAAAQAARHQINEQLIDEMLARMQDGNAALSIGRAIFSTAPGQHIRIYLSENRLRKALREAQVDGSQPSDEPDRVAFYTQNQNASKVDIFQERLVIHDVRLEAEGSAQVLQTAKVTNAAPAEGGSPLSDRIGYTTRWAFHWNVVFLPKGATDVTLAANPGDIKEDDRVFKDVDGSEAIRVGRWIPPGESSYITLSYSLPPGTFGSDGNLEYRVGVEHQLLIKPVQLMVNVDGPSTPTPVKGEWTIDADRASTSFTIEGPTTLALKYGGGR